MTNDQIKQNAEAYAFALTRSDEIAEHLIHGFIAGAHSMLEEIKELKEELSSIQEHYDSLFDGFSKRGKKIGELMKENVKLRNPWIKSSEQMPVDGDDIVYLLYDGKAGRMKYHNNEKWLLESVTHWMKVTLKED